MNITLQQVVVVVNFTYECICSISIIAIVIFSTITYGSCCCFILFLILKSRNAFTNTCTIQLQILLNRAICIQFKHIQVHL